MYCAVYVSKITVMPISERPDPREGELVRYSSFHNEKGAAASEHASKRQELPVGRARHAILAALTARWPGRTTSLSAFRTTALSAFRGRSCAFPAS